MNDVVTAFSMILVAGGTVFAVAMIGVVIGVLLARWPGRVK